MRGRFLLAASLAWVFTIALGMLAIFRVYLLPRTIPSGSPDGTANISYSEPSNDNVVVGVLHKEIVTWLDIKYVQQIDASSSERVTAEVDQAEVITDLNTKQPREPSHLPKLNRPVRMLLQSAAFDFGNDDGVLVPTIQYQNTRHSYLDPNTSSSGKSCSKSSLKGCLQCHRDYQWGKQKPPRQRRHTLNCRCANRILAYPVSAKLDLVARRWDFVYS